MGFFGTYLAEGSFPAGQREVLVWQRDAVRHISSPIENPQEGVVERAGPKMIFDNNDFLGDPDALGEKPLTTYGMVKNIHTNYRLECVVGEWDRHSLVKDGWNCYRRAKPNL